MISSLPRLDRFHLAIAEPRTSSPLSIDDASLESDAVPLLDSPPLRELALPGMKVVIAFTDATRPSPDKALVSMLRRELAAAGVRPEEIALLCAVGLHRPMTSGELLAKLGEENLRGVRVLNHSATDAEGIVEIDLIDGIPVTASRLCAGSDLLIATGIVEPHQYAGFSGGAKTVAIGCAGEETIRRTHGLEMLDRAGTRLGRIEGNPFQEFVRGAGNAIGLRYAVNVLPDADGRTIAAACGNPSAVHDYLSGRCTEGCAATVARPAHIAVAGVPPSKTVNLYQASRAATYVGLADRTPLLPGGPIVIPALIPEGAGEGKGERAFFEALSGAASPSELIERFRRDGFPAGAQRAYVLANVLTHHPVIVAGAANPDVVRRCHMEPALDLESALDRADEIARYCFGMSIDAKPDLLVVPNALTTLVTLAASDSAMPATIERYSG